MIPNTNAIGVFFQTAYFSCLQDNKTNKFAPHLHLQKKKMFLASVGFVLDRGSARGLLEAPLRPPEDIKT